MYPETGYKCKLQLLPYTCKVCLNAHVFFTYAKFNISAVVSIYALPSFSVTFLRKLLSMLSKQQKLLLAQLVRDHKMIVLVPFSLKVTKKAKQEAWEMIRTQLNGIGANIDSAKTLRDVLWANIRRSTLKKVSESKKAISGGSGELTELDILDILRRKSANIEPVKVEDSDIVFGEEKIVTTTPSAESKIIIILCKRSNPLKRATVLAQGGSCSKQKPISKGGRALSYVANLEWQFYIPTQVLKLYSETGTSC